MIPYTAASLRNVPIAEEVSTDELIVHYFHAGYNVLETRGFLIHVHRIQISERQIRLILNRLNLGRRRNSPSSLEEVIPILMQEYRYQNLGYRMLRQRLVIDHGLNVSHETVRVALNVIDPEGVARRRGHRFQRRVFDGHGPNYIVQIDGWDKLKPYGISIHGAIDGFSHKVLWLRACESNKNPCYICHFYLEYVKEIQGVPRIVTADRGTENCHVRDVQRILRWRENYTVREGLSSFMYTSSPRNQRIERFWRSFRGLCGESWIELFKTLAEEGILDISDQVHLELIRICCMQIMQEDLNRVVRLWNQHKIQVHGNSIHNGFKPDVLYYTPEVVNATEYKSHIAANLLELEAHYCTDPPVATKETDFHIAVLSLMMDHNLNLPSTRNEALVLFGELLNILGV